MTKKKKLGWGFFVLVMALAVTAQGNLLQNSGFESNAGSGSSADYWVNTTEAGVESWAAQTDSWGMAFVTWRGDGTGDFCQDVNVVENTLCTYKIWASRDGGDLTGTYHMKIEWYNGDTYISEDSQLLDITDVWTQKTLIATSPAGADIARVMISGVGIDRVGKFDDAEFTTVPPIPPSEIVIPSQSGSAEACGRNNHGECDVPADNDFVAVAAGTQHNVALRSDGSLAAWGWNNYGQCDVPAGNDFVDVAAGEYHSVALKADGSLGVWSINAWGMISNMPTGNDFVAVASSMTDSIALKRDGSIVSWGSGYFDQGNVPVGNDFVVIASSASSLHGLAIRSDGTLAAWGDNSDGQCDDAPTSNDFVAIACGRSHSLAIRQDGSLEAWGSNTYGQRNVPAGNDFVAVAAGSNHNVALRSDGSVVAWGRNDFGQCNVSSGKQFIAVAAGYFHSVALKDFCQSGSAEAWGKNDDGQCSDVPLSNDFVALAGGTNYSLALKSDGSLEAWGRNDFGQCDVPDGNDFVAISTGGDGDHGLVLKSDGSLEAWGWLFYTNPPTPSGNDFVAVSAGYHHNLALKSDGSIVAWGADYFDQCSDVPDGNDFIAIAAGYHHNLAIKSDGSLAAWGRNDDGQCNVPDGNFVAVVGGWSHSVALKSDDSLEAWGNDNYDQLNVPDGNFVAIAGGGFHSIALKSDGSLEAWGRNDDGQCNVPAGKQFIAISAGRYHSLALKAPVVSYEPYETDLVVTSPDSGMTLEVVRGGINGVPPATQGDYVLKMDWTGETGGKVELKHNCLNFDLAGEDLLLVDVYTRTHGLYIEDSFSAIWDDAFGWHTTDTPTDNEWGTVEFDVSSCNQTGLVEITALMFESLGLDYGTIYIDNIRLGYNEAALDSPENVTATGYDSRIDLTWGIVTQPELQGYNIYRSTSVDGTFTKINDSLHPAVASVYSDFFGTNGQTYYYYVKAVNKAEVESAASATVSAASYVMEPNEILTTVQEATFRYFWDYGHPVSGLAREGYECGHGSDVVTTGGTGMGLMAICVGAERGFVTRAEAAERTLKILTFLNDEEKAPRFHGAWPHWLNGATGGLVLFGKQDGCDIPETSFLIQGMLTARKYFDDMNDATEADINDIATELWEDVEWDWFLRRSDAGYENSETLYWLWSPTVGFNLGEDPNNPLKVRGYNECMIAYILAIASPTHPIPASCYYSGWASSDDYINGGTLYTHKQWAGIDYGGNLFWTHYSYLGLDPDWSDAYCNYFDNNRNISLIQHAYAVDNPGNYDGYSNLVWGFTACSSPPDCSYNHSIPGEDDGTIGPTAALSAMIYTPSESIATLEHFYDYNTYGDNMWGAFGFVDGFNLSKDPDWFAPGYLAIDQGPIVVMMENHRTGLCWNKFMANTEINDALDDIAAVTVMFDDFDGDNINDAWYGNGGTWPTIDNTNSEQLYNGSYALKVTYDKDDETWVYVSSPVSVGSKDFSDFKKLGTLVYSDRAVNYTAKIEYSGGSVEQEFSVPANAWTNIVLDFSAQSSQMTNVNRVLYFPDTGAYDTSGTFWLDNIVLW